MDYFFVNEIEAGQITGYPSDDPEKLMEGLRSIFPKAHTILTLGSAGSAYIYQGEIIRKSIYKVKAVDTTAAGDTFTGYFLASVIGGRTPEAALDLAARASAVTVSRPGAAPSIPVMDEVLNYRF